MTGSGTIEADKPTPRSAVTFGTFGIYRYFLATLVMTAHTGPLAWAVVGPFTMRAFFILSGYVVCFILRYSYLRLKGGILKYAATRALRIFPAYLVTCVLSLCLAYISSARTLELFDWFGTLQDFSVTPLVAWIISLMPVSWSLGTEFFYWILMPVMLGSSWARRGMIIFALAYTGYVFSQASLAHSFHYFKLSYLGLQPSALPFCVGLLVFLHKEKTGRPVPRWLGIACICLFPALLVYVWGVIGNPFSTAADFTALALSAATIAWLSRIDQNKLPGRLRKLDRFCANLAYPIFLLHLPVAVTLHILFPALVLHSCAFMALTIGCTTPAALLLHLCVQAPVDRLRYRIKH